VQLEQVEQLLQLVTTAATSSQESEAALDWLLNDATIPIVNNLEEKILIGSIQMALLSKKIKEYHRMSGIKSRRSASKKRRQQEEDDQPHLLVIETPDEPIVCLTQTPHQFADITPISQLHILFVVLQLSKCFITRDGVLRGQLTRQDLAEGLEK